MGTRPTAEDRVALKGAEVRDEDLQDWRWVLNSLVARFETGDFNAGASLVSRIAEVADEADHHPDVDLRYPHVTVSLISHDVHAITARDVRLARRISEVAAAVGARATQPPDVLELALDTPDREAVKPFWRAMLGYVETPDVPDEIIDGAARTTTVWFQETESEAPDRQRWHLDVSVPAEVAEDRVQAVIAAGGRLVSDERAPAFWVLSDPEGNLGCICTWQARD